MFFLSKRKGQGWVHTLKTRTVRNHTLFETVRNALKKINKELEDNFEMTCSSQADQLNKNAKDKIDAEEASGLAYRKLEAECNRKILQLKKRIVKLQAEIALSWPKKYKTKTRCLHLIQNKKNDLVRIQKLESQIEQLHVVTRDNPLFIIPTKRTNLKQGDRVGATVLGKIDRQHVYILRMHNGRYGRLHISQIFDGKCTWISLTGCSNQAITSTPRSKT